MQLVICESHDVCDRKTKNSMGKCRHTYPHYSNHINSLCEVSSCEHIKNKKSFCKPIKEVLSKEVLNVSNM